MATTGEQPITAGTILKKSINLYISTFNKVLPILILFSLLLPFTKFIMVKLVHNPDLFAYIEQSPDHKGIITIACIGIVFFIINLFLNSSMIYLVGKHIRNETITTFQALQKALSKLITVVFSHIILALLIATLAIICYFLGKLTIVAVGLLILSIILVIIMVRFNFFIPAILFDNAAILRSLSESYKLTMSYWWRTFALTIIAGLPNVPFIMAQHFVTQPIAILLQIVDIIIVYPFTYNILLLQFFDLKVRHA